MATFPLDIRTELQLGGSWTDVSSDVYVRDAKQITRGLRDQGSAADPSSLYFTLNNKGGKYSRRNAMSPLYGLLMQNTPVRLSVPTTGDSYLQLDGTSGSQVSTAAAGARWTGGDLDVRVEMAGNWYGPANQWLIGQWADGQQSWSIALYRGNIWFRRTLDGDEVGTGRYYVAPLPKLPERAALRTVFDADDGAGNHSVTFYWAASLDSTDWAAFSRVIKVAGPATSFTGSAPVQIGITHYRSAAIPSEQRIPPDGRIYRAEIRNAIGGALSASPDFRAAPDRGTSVTDAQGNLWSLGGHAEIRAREDRFVGEISTWPLRWTTDDADVYTSIQANGIMRRLGQGAKALDSALRRRIPAGKPVAYWPLEESTDATRAYSPISGVFPASMTGVDWASWDTLPSSQPLPKLQASAAFVGNVPAFTPGAWQVEFVYNADNKTPTDTTKVISFTSADGYIRRWDITLQLGLAIIRGYDAGHVRQVDQGVAIGADVFNGWTRLRFWAQDDADGSGFSWRINWQDVGGDAGGYTGTVATGTCGSVSSVVGDWGAGTEGWGIGHIFVLSNANNALLDGSDNAYSGEYSWSRMRRLAGEEGVSVSRTAGALSPAFVGFQRSNTLLDLFEAAAGADGGLLTEDMHRIGLHYRDRSSMYTQTPALQLSYTAPGLGPDIEPVDDDVNVVNDVTVTRDGGSSGRAVLEDGPLSVQAPPNGIGRYDASYTLSLANDDQAEPIAYWRLHHGTWDAARYPTVTVMLHKPGAESLIPAVLGMREGDKIRLTDLPGWVSHEDVDLIVLGWNETLDLYRWEVTFNCVPAGPWDTAVVEHDTYSKVDSDGSELQASVTATDTSLMVTTTAGQPWTDDPADMPFSVAIAGEEMQVTAVGDTISDGFGRTTSSGWGTADSGQVWTRSGGSASDFSTNGSAGLIACTSINTSRYCVMPSPFADLTLQTNVSTSVAATGGSHYAGLVARYSDTGNLYNARVGFKTSGVVELTLQKRVAGAQTDLQVVTTPYSYAPGQMFTLVFDVQGSTLRARVWPAGQADPGAWQASVTDTSLTAAGSVGTRTLLSSSNTNVLPVTLTYDEFSMLNSQRFTVVRAVNGVSKSQSAGAGVSLAHPALISL
ncbi:hypothetical protein ACF1A5_11360 [Streptomyces sp. NPDC014864]|uniref:hypothetical protein n=1 Tax=Streptomyces sp. NPDC014864 TaxID=3364924 RepID=UPI0036FF5E71